MLKQYSTAGGKETEAEWSAMGSIESFIASVAGDT